jgi:hypothetical protein
MPRYEVNDSATRETRRKGALAAAAAKRRRRVAAEQAAGERIAVLAEQAVEGLERALASTEEQVAFRACKEVLDRVLGKPQQAIDIGWPSTFDPSLLSDEDLDAMHGLLLKAQPHEEQ